MDKRNVHESSLINGPLRNRTNANWQFAYKDFLRNFAHFIPGKKQFCGAGMFIPDHDFCPSRIPEATTAPKRWGNFFCPSIFCSHKYHKILINFYFWTGKENLFSKKMRVIVPDFLPKSLSLSYQNYGFRIRDPVSRKNPIPDPGSKRHCIPDPQRWKKV